METIQTNKKIKVLDKGSIELIDIMPKNYQDPQLKCDEAIVRAARVSYNQSSKGTERDTKLIQYLIEHHHSVPLESIVFQFKIKCPIFVQRHIVKHRMTSMNEVSARYTKVIDEWYVPQEVRKQCTKNKQSSNGTLPNNLIEIFDSSCQSSYKQYEELLSQGVSREMARIILPQSMYTEFFWKIDLRNALHFCNLRNSTDSQWETQQYAKAIEEIIKETNPVSYKAFRNM